MTGIDQNNYGFDVFTARARKDRIHQQTVCIRRANHIVLQCNGPIDIETDNAVINGTRFQTISVGICIQDDSEVREWW